MQAAPDYLQPYTTAARRYAGGFGSLLWASPKTQRARFEALTRVENFQNRFLLDAGSGRSDFLDFLLSHQIVPSRYIGIEAVPELMAAARTKDDRFIIQGDFVRNPGLMNVAPDTIVFSGSLNTLPPDTFYVTLSHAFRAARHDVVFNFLSSPTLAGKPFLHWHHPGDVVNFARTLTSNIAKLCDYLEGDCTVAIRKRTELQ